MSTVVEAPVKRRPKRTAKRPAQSGYGPGSRIAQPMPAPGETACFGLGDWETYLGLDRALQGRGYRVRYFKGILEIMSISFDHESISRRLAQLVVAFCEWMGLDYEFWGSATQKKVGNCRRGTGRIVFLGSEPKENLTSTSKWRSRVVVSKNWISGVKLEPRKCGFGRTTGFMAL